MSINRGMDKHVVDTHTCTHTHTHTEEYYSATAAAAKLLQSCPTLCDPMDCSPPGSFIHGIFQAKVLEWGAIVFSDSAIKKNEAAATAAKSLQSCPTLCDPMDCSLPGSSIHGIFQARVLEWVAIAFSDFFESSLMFL